MAAWRVIAHQRNNRQKKRGIFALRMARAVSGARR